MGGAPATLPEMRQSKLTLSAQIQNLKPGKPFIVHGKVKRQHVCRVAKTLRDAGHLKFDVVTVAQGNDVFKVAAV